MATQSKQPDLDKGKNRGDRIKTRDELPGPQPKPPAETAARKAPKKARGKGKAG